MNNELSVTARDPYTILEIERKATAEEVKRSYFLMVRQHPPEQDPERFQEIRQAYEKLRDPESRALVDMFLLQEPPAPPNRRRSQYDLSVHPEDLLRLAVELVAKPMQQDFREIALIWLNLITNYQSPNRILLYWDLP